jgi:hypothetical protein
VAPEVRRNYKNVVDCMARIAKEEGPKALMTGVVPTVARASSLAAVLMGVTSTTRDTLNTVAPFSGFTSTIPVTFVATGVGSLFANFVAMPFDVVKSRMQVGFR